MYIKWNTTRSMVKLAFSSLYAVFIVYDIKTHLTAGPQFGAT